MPKDKNMGRKSHHVEDADYDQNFNLLSDDIPTDQTTRPSLGKQQSTKGPKEDPKDTK